MLKIPFYKPSIGAEEIDEVLATLKSGWLTTGPRTKQFEREFGDYLKHKHAIAVNSCTAALHLALEAIGLKAGQGVIVPTMTFAATAEVVRYFGARPILVDCRVEDFNLDVADAKRKIQSSLAAGQSIAAIMPVHYGGQIGDVAGVRALAQRYNLKVIEDAAHCCPAFYKSEVGGQPSEIGKAISRAEESGNTLATPHPALSPTEAERETGPEVSGHLSVVGSPPSAISDHSSLVTRHLSPANAWLPVGTGADISCYSFYANKTITTGEGGMACAENDEYADRMRIMSLHGISRDAWKRYTAEGSWFYEIIAPGFKYNLTDIAAAIGIHQLRKADLFHRRRAELAALYAELLKEVEEIILPQVQPDRIHSWHLFAIRLRLERLKIDRAQFITGLQQRGIGTSVHWMPLHMHPYYRETFGYAPEDLPVACSLYPEIITLPIFPDMTEDEVIYVCRSIKEIVATNQKAGGRRKAVASSQQSVVSSL
jgi:dTDP-4-amino-4,6-dideoxygalactose transaminase